MSTESELALTAHELPAWEGAKAQFIADGHTEAESTTMADLLIANARDLAETLPGAAPTGH